MIIVHSETMPAEDPTPPVSDAMRDCFDHKLVLAWRKLRFPVNGSHFDRRMGGVTMAIVAAVVTMVWAPPR